jgi:hypothetical protein
VEQDALDRPVDGIGVDRHYRRIQRRVQILVLRIAALLGPVVQDGPDRGAAGLAAQQQMGHRHAVLVSRQGAQDQGLPGRH